MQKGREVQNIKCANHYRCCSDDCGKVVFKAFITLQQNINSDSEKLNH